MRHRIVVGNLLLVIVSRMSTAAMLTATPNPFKWRREILLGTNSDFYYTYVLERNQPGSYYRTTDFVSMCQYNLKTGELVQKTLLMEKTSAYDFDKEKWTKEVHSDGAFDMPEFLAANNVRPAFPTRLYQRRLEITEEGLFLIRDRVNRDPVRALVLTREQLPSTLVDPPESARILGIFIGTGSFSCPAYYLLLIESGLADNSGDYDYSQSILVLPHRIVDKADKEALEKLTRLN